MWLLQALVGAAIQPALSAPAEALVHAGMCFARSKEGLQIPLLVLASSITVDTMAWSVKAPRSNPALFKQALSGPHFDPSSVPWPLALHAPALVAAVMVVGWPWMVCARSGTSGTLLHTSLKNSGTGSFPGTLV